MNFNFSGIGLKPLKSQTCEIKNNEQLETREIIPSVYKKVIEYFKSKMSGSYVDIVGTFGISNTTVFSDIDLNLYSTITSINQLYEHLKSLGDTGKTGYIYSDLKIGNVHFTKKDLQYEYFRDVVFNLPNDPQVIKHDIIFYDGEIYREASFFLLFRNDSNLAYLNLDRDVINSLKESFMEEYNKGNYMKAIKRLLSLCKAVGNQTFISKLLYYIDSEYNELSMILSGMDTLRMVIFYLDPNDKHIEDCITNLLYLYESINIKGLPILSYVRDALYSSDENDYINLIDGIRSTLNLNLANNLQCKNIKLMNIYVTL